MPAGIELTSEGRGRVRAGRLALLIFLCVIGGRLAAAADAAGGSAPWAWVAVLPLLAAMYALRPGAAGLCGAAWGLSLGLPAEATPASFASVSSVLLIFLKIILPAGYALVGSLATRRIGFNPFVLGVGWMILELTLTAFDARGGLIADGIVGGIVPRLIGDIFGSAVVAFLAVMINGLVIELVRTVVGVLGDIPRPATTNAAGRRRRARGLHPYVSAIGILPLRPRGPPVRSG